MKLNGTKVTLEVVTPDSESPVTTPVEAKISSRVEYADVSFTDLDGDPFSVVPVQLDIEASRISYKILSAGTFGDVDDETGFNGYLLTFNALGEDSGITLRAADLVTGKTTLDIDASNVFVDDTKLFVNVDDLGFSTGDTITIEFGFQITGTAGKDNLSGLNGRDLLWGGAKADELGGGKGADIFQFLGASESRGKSHDVILDFRQSQEDTIDVAQLLSGQTSDEFAFIDTDTFSREGVAELRYEFKKGDTIVRADIDGNGSTDFMVELQGKHALLADDFVLSL